VLVCFLPCGRRVHRTGELAARLRFVDRASERNLYVDVKWQTKILSRFGG
jgi:hypothetical protein